MNGQALEPGTRLGPYEILEPLGAGGMGEVYKARDTRLERVVAIKLLMRQWAEDSEMRQRFAREAQIIASLSHPNICVLHDIGQQDGVNFLVMEYLEGESLATRLERGALEAREALKIAIAITDALDKAHRHGVVHRDLKPGNVVLTAGGPKLLDFGLAKARKEGPVSGRDSSRLLTAANRPGGPQSSGPTQANLTMPGAVMGTLQYMAPEQLAGEDADARTDIFALGTMVHEMITGKKAFEGKSRILLMSAIATAQPEPLSNVQPAVPKSLDHVVKTCLAKDPADRWQSTRDLLAGLKWVADEGSEETAGTESASAAPTGRSYGKLSWILLAAAAALLAATALPAAMYFRGRPAEEEFRIRIPMAGSAQPYDSFTGGPNSDRVVAGTNFAVSPDGRSLAYFAKFAAPPEPHSLYVRPIGSVTPRKLLSIEDAAINSVQPFWSADSRFIGFITRGKLKKVEASGGPPQDICDAANFFGGTWNREGVILFGSSPGLFRVSGEGGKPEAVTILEQGEVGHYWPHFLPDGRHFLYTAWSGDTAKRMVFVGELGSKERTPLLAAESNAGYAAPGFLVFHRENAVYAQPFDWKKPALSGEPVRVADEISFVAATGWGDFAVTPGGVLAYFQNANVQSVVNSGLEFQLQWVDRGGKQLDTPGPLGVYRGIEASPDGKRIAVHRHDAAGGDIIVIEPRGSTTSLTFDASRHNSSPVWSPNGDRIAYAALSKGQWGVYQNLSNGSGTEELLYESELPKAPMSWSPDGKRIVFWTEDPKTGSDLWILTLEDKKAAPLIASPFQETHGQISPDGKWIAYTSNSTDRNEVYVQQFPSGSGRYQISFHGGDWPRWRGDGKELFYHAIASVPDAPASTSLFRGGSLLSAEVTVKGGVLEPGSPKDIVRTLAINDRHSGGDYQIYSVSADGQRILTFQVYFNPASGGDAAGPEPPLSITVATNWSAALKR